MWLLVAFLGTAESLRDKAMKYYSECQAEKAQASASKPSLSSFGSKGSSMGSMGSFRIDECPKDEETKAKPVNKDRFISKMFLRGDSVIIVVKNPLAAAIPGTK
uniref:Small nuclear ribonucleoprotein Sm D2 n=1 Tax=Timema californicum TaxID=61474 RepID=A0A7R9J374_TIMCA|nr:unnamed protein product [Timema californicum]